MTEQRKKITRSSKIWEVLEEAKKLLWDGDWDTEYKGYTYICHAISAVHGFNEYDLEKRNTKSHRLIQKLLGDCTTVEDFLAEVLPSKVYWREVTGERVQQYRHRWLDHLIKDCKAKDI